MALVYINHWADKTCELPHANPLCHAFPLRCDTIRIRSPLYFHPLNMYYGLYPVDTGLSDFTVIAYEAEIILRLTTKPEMGWYAQNMNEIQRYNGTIGFMGFTRSLTTHQETSWTQQLYKDKDTRISTQRIHHPHSATPISINRVIDTMKIDLFYDESTTQLPHYLHGVIIYLHIHCTHSNL